MKTRDIITKFISFFVVMVITMVVNTKATSAMDFNDVKGHWAEKYINWAADKGYINGYNDGSFKPNEPLMRAELFTIINSLYESGDSPENLSWADSAAERIKKSGLALTKFEIYSEDGLKKLLPAGRIEAFQLLAAVYNFYTVNDEPIPELYFDEYYYPKGAMIFDKRAINVFVKMATETGVMKGFPDGTYGPYKILTRAQFCKMLYDASMYRFPDGNIVKQNDTTWKKRTQELIKTKLPNDKRGLYVAIKNPKDKEGYRFIGSIQDELNGDDYEEKDDLISSLTTIGVRKYYHVRGALPLSVEKMERRGRDNELFLDQWYNKIVEGYDGDNSDYDKAKYIHDIIIKSTRYIPFDIEKYGELQAVAKFGNNDFAKPISVARGTGSICQAYARCFDELAKMMGLQSVFVVGKTSKKISHAWNKVKIDGKWYNVDATWDDPKIPGLDVNVSGREKSENFLRSDYFISQTRVQNKEFEKYVADSDYK